MAQPDQSNKKDAFILYVDMLSIVDTISDLQCATLFRAIYHFHHDMIMPEMDQLTETLFVLFKTKFNSDTKSYRKKIEEKSIAGKLGNLKRWNPDLYKLVSKNGLSIEDAYKIHEKQIADEAYKKYGVNGKTSQCDNLSQSDNSISERNFIATVQEPLSQQEPLSKTYPKNKSLEEKQDFSQFDFSLFMSGDEKKDNTRKETLLRILKRNFKLAQDAGTSYLDFVDSIQSHLYDRYKKGEDVFAAINNTISSGIKTIIAPKEPYVQLTPEERKKLKEEQLKKEERNNILSNYCRGVTYDEAMTQLNKDKKDRMRHFPFRPQEVITKLECDKYGIVYPTKRQWDIFNTEKERFLLKAGGFTEGECK